MKDTVLQSESAAQTAAVGHELAQHLCAGDVVHVSGDLGSGKSTLIRGALQQLGVAGSIASPTYVIGAIYELEDGRVAHLDLYRLNDPCQEDPGLLDPYFGDDLITFIEWPEKGAKEFSRQEPRFTVQLDHRSSASRQITITNSGSELSL